MNRPELESIREELLVTTEERAEALRLYLEQEENQRKAEEILEVRLRERMDRGLNFAI
jgi:hypothetical protein